jgi:hypothetical protein
LLRCNQKSMNTRSATRSTSCISVGELPDIAQEHRAVP